MAGTAISQLSGTFTSYAAGNLLVMVDVTDTSMAVSGTDKKITASSFLANYSVVTLPGSTSITTLGTITTGTWQGSAIAAAYLTPLHAAGASHSAGIAPDPGAASHSPYYVLGDDATWHAQSTITNLGTIAVGTWQGTIVAPAYLTAMVAAGASHSAGIVPDPGASSHSPYYILGDDATWHAQSSITNLGTIAVGTWQGTAIATAYLTAMVAAGASHSAGIVPDPGAASHSPFYVLGDDATWHAQTAITNLGTITTGVWNGTAILPAYLTVLTASGVGHTAGIAPDPGASAGTTRYLREDASWQTAVTSVTFTGDGTVLSSTPSGAVTTSGTIAASLKTQNANLVLAGPSSGGAVAPTFRSLVAGDIPSTLNPTTIAAGSDVAVAVLKANSTQTHDLLTVESSTPTIQGGINSNYNLYGAIAPDVITGRLTLSSTLPLVDAASGTTLYYLPYNGRGCITLYNTTSSQYENWLTGTSGVSLALSTSASTLYDIFIYNNSGTLTLESVAWSSSVAGSSTRATTITNNGDYWYKTGSQGHRYLGTIYCTSTNTTKDIPSSRCVWNVANQVAKPVALTYTPSPNPFNISNLTNTSTMVWGVISGSGGSNPMQIPIVSGFTQGSAFNCVLSDLIYGSLGASGQVGLALSLNNSSSPANSFTFTPLSGTNINLYHSVSVYAALGYNLASCLGGVYSTSTSSNAYFYDPVNVTGLYMT